MKVTEARFTRRFNLGDYEHEEYSATALVGEEESLVEVFEQIKKDIMVSSGRDESDVGVDTEEVKEEEVVEKEEKPKAKRGRKKKEKKDARATRSKASTSVSEDEEDWADEEGDGELDGQGDEHDEASDLQDSVDYDSDAEGDEDVTDDDTLIEEYSLNDEDSSDEEVEQEEKPKRKTRKKAAKSDAGGKKASKKKTKKLRKKPQVYDRDNIQHKDIFGGVVRSLDPKWRSSPSTRARVKQASTKLEGVEFLDETGEVLPEFIEKVKKWMKKKKG